MPNGTSSWRLYALLCNTSVDCINSATVSQVSAVLFSKYSHESGEKTPTSEHPAHSGAIKQFISWHHGLRLLVQTAKRTFSTSGLASSANAANLSMAWNIVSMPSLSTSLAILVQLAINSSKLTPC